MRCTTVKSIGLVTMFGAFACSSARVNTDAGDGDGVTGVGDAHRQQLCDGAQHLRLWVLVGGGGQQLDGSRVRTENGSPVITIDGTCSFWVGGGWSEHALSNDRPFRTGKLSDADVSSIEASVPLADINALADCPPPVGLFDYSTRVIRTEMATVTCPGTRGARFDAAWSTLQMIAARLWETGTSMEGALHVSAVGPASLPPTPTSPPAYAWPITLALESFILDSADWSRIGVSRLVDDPEAARELRAMRDRYLADRTAQPGLYSNWDGLIASDPGVTAKVYMRDAIPYEDAQGLLKF